MGWTYTRQEVLEGGLNINECQVVMAECVNAFNERIEKVLYWVDDFQAEKLTYPTLSCGFTGIDDGDVADDYKIVINSKTEGITAADFGVCSARQLSRWAYHLIDAQLTSVPTRAFFKAKLGEGMFGDFTPSHMQGWNVVPGIAGHESGGALDSYVWFLLMSIVQSFRYYAPRGLYVCQKYKDILDPDNHKFLGHPSYSMDYVVGDKAPIASTLINTVRGYTAGMPHPIVPSSTDTYQVGNPPLSGYRALNIINKAVVSMDIGSPPGTLDIMWKRNGYNGPSTPTGTFPTDLNPSSFGITLVNPASYDGWQSDYGADEYPKSYAGAFYDVSSACEYGLN